VRRSRKLSVPPFYLTGKQNNVLLDADNTARLTDFGFASLVGDIPEALTYLQMSTIQPGAMRWAAPEHVLAENAFDMTTKSDIYSFGCIGLQESLLNMTTGPIFILSQALSGKQPWSEVRRDPQIVLLLGRGQKPGRPESRAIADQHWDFIQQCWSSAQDRPPTDSIITSIEMFLNSERGTDRTNRTQSDSVTLKNLSLVPLDPVPIDGPDGRFGLLPSDEDDSSSLLQTNVEQQPEVDTEHNETAQGPSQVSEEPPAMVGIENLERDDIVRAYVIQLSTVKCLTSYP